MYGQWMPPANGVPGVPGFPGPEVVPGMPPAQPNPWPMLPMHLLMQQNPADWFAQGPPGSAPAPVPAPGQEWSAPAPVPPVPVPVSAPEAPPAEPQWPGYWPPVQWPPEGAPAPGPVPGPAPGPESVPAPEPVVTPAPVVPPETFAPPPAVEKPIPNELDFKPSTNGAPAVDSAQVMSNVQMAMQQLLAMRAPPAPGSVSNNAYLEQKESHEQQQQQQHQSYGEQPPQQHSYDRSRDDRSRDERPRDDRARDDRPRDHYNGDRYGDDRGDRNADRYGGSRYEDRNYDRHRSRSRGRSGDRLGDRGRGGRDKGGKGRRRGKEEEDCSNLIEMTHETSAEVIEFRAKHTIRVFVEQAGPPVPDPFPSFDCTGFLPAVLQEFVNAGFQAPSPIQSQAWPIILSSRDMIGVAKTGSGKTLAFALPAFKHILESRARGPSMLVLAPTRELATQIEVEIRRFGKSAGILSVSMYGGAPKHEQLHQYRSGAHIIIACPGRLNDFLEGRQVDLRDVRYLVMDEADRMLDMGFEPQIRKIVAQITSQRQTLLFTATWPKEVRALAADFTRDPVHVKVGDTDQLKGNEDITQKVIIVNSPRDKTFHLNNILRENQGVRIIIFSATKRMCERLCDDISRSGMRATSIHGDKDQRQRDHALAEFRSGNTLVLVATDVAARGLDIKGVKVVLNYDTPSNDEDYVHRIGRTGRAGEKGVAYTFLGPEDAGRKAMLIMQVMERSDQVITEELKNFANLPNGSNSRGKGGKGKGRDFGGSFGGSFGDRDRFGGDRFGGRDFGGPSRDFGGPSRDGGFRSGGGATSYRNRRGGSRSRSRSRDYRRRDRSFSRDRRRRRSPSSPRRRRSYSRRRSPRRSRRSPSVRRERRSPSVRREPEGGMDGNSARDEPIDDGAAM